MYDALERWAWKLPEYRNRTCMSRTNTLLVQNVMSVCEVSSVLTKCRVIFSSKCRAFYSLAWSLNKFANRWIGIYRDDQGLINIFSVLFSLIARMSNWGGVWGCGQNSVYIILLLTSAILSLLLRKTFSMLCISARWKCLCSVSRDGFKKYRKKRDCPFINFYINFTQFLLSSRAITHISHLLKKKKRKIFSRYGNMRLYKETVALCAEKI